MPGVCSFYVQFSKKKKARAPISCLHECNSWHLDNLYFHLHETPLWNLKNSTFSVCVFLLLLCVHLVTRLESCGAEDIQGHCSYSMCRMSTANCGNRSGLPSALAGRVCLTTLCYTAATERCPTLGGDDYNRNFHALPTVT